MLLTLQKFCGLLTLLLTVLYLYKVFYVAASLVLRRRHAYGPAKRQHRFAAVVCARNEQAVIAEVIDCLKRQDYPAHLLDVYVVADNCTDETAAVARRHGALVYERFDAEKVGKGYAMDWLFSRLKAEGMAQQYEGYLIFDADNLVDPGFVREMNAVFDTGKYDAITCYRNTKNYDSNWISAGYSLWFLREARFLNFPRMLLGTGCAVSGTGYLISSRVIREEGGWPFHLLTEDIEFSVDCAVKGRKIGYCDKAIVYDEQPTRFGQSWRQRLRWSKGFYQVGARYWWALLKGCVTCKGGRFACFDMLMTVAPGMLLSLAIFGFQILLILSGLTQPLAVAAKVLSKSVQFLCQSGIGFYIGLMLYGGLTLVSEWRQIAAPAAHKLTLLFLFPLFMFTYIPISLVALFRRVEWKPIRHHSAAAFRGRGAAYPSPQPVAERAEGSLLGEGQGKG